MDLLIVCIGNRDGGDDAIGPYIADQLQKKDGCDMGILDVGVVPENFTGVIKKKNPKKLILIDAVDMQKNPGDIRIVPMESIPLMHISTHGIPLSVFIKYLQQNIKDITFIGIQSKTMEGKMSLQIKQAADQLIELLLNKQIFKIKSFDA